MPRLILMVVNDPAFFISHRLPVAQGAKNAGYDVHIATGAGEACGKIVGAGFVHYLLPLTRNGKNLFVELNTFIALYRLMRRIKPDLVHLVTIKPILYGGIAARLARVPCVVAAVSGLGMVFISQGLQAKLLRILVKALYRLAFWHKNIKVIFQNPDDKRLLVHLSTLTESQAVLVRGSGVKLADYPMLPEPTGVPVVVMAARLLKDKGIEEFIAAARLLKFRGLNIDFWLIGSPDYGNPTTITERQLSIWNEEGLVKLLGYRKDISAIFAQSNIVVLPSYREGLPKVLMEAAACGRAVVTTDVPGCRDSIEPNVTGILVQVKNEIALADAIQKLIEDSKLRQSFGLAGRKLAEEAFSVEKVIAKHLAIYRELIAGL